MDTPHIDPDEEAKVEALIAAISAGSIDLPGIGEASIVASCARVQPTFPPVRTTTLTLVVKHNA